MAFPASLPPAPRPTPDRGRRRDRAPAPGTGRDRGSVPGADAGVTESGLPVSGLPSLGCRPACRPARPAAAGSPAAAAARPYGRILIFTLLDDRVADFDRLAEESAEYVRTGEPDTLVYVIHLVPNAPLQRIFYEIYRDRAAFDSHESQPYMQRFVAERRTCVLATNVIELRLKYAKVAPLPGPPSARPSPRRFRSGPPPRARRLSGPGRCPRPARSVPDPQRSGQPGYGQPGYGQPGVRPARVRPAARRPGALRRAAARPAAGSVGPALRRLA